MGADLIGASLNASADPSRALEALFDLAEQSGLPVDLHLDEHLEPDHMLAGMVADAVIARGLQGRVTLSHLCVLATLGAAAASALIEKFAHAGVTVVALPAANLFLQDRGEGSPIRRGVTLARELLAAGVPVRCGTDNVRDWFYPFGDGDMLETALFAAVAAHLDDQAALSRRDLRRPSPRSRRASRRSRSVACVFARRRLGATSGRTGRVQRRTAGRGRCCAGRGQIKGDVDYQGIAEQVFLATDTAKLMREMGLTPPASTSKPFVVMGKTFDPSKPDDYVQGFSIKRS